MLNNKKLYLQVAHKDTLGEEKCQRKIIHHDMVFQAPQQQQLAAIPFFPRTHEQRLSLLRLHKIFQIKMANKVLFPLSIAPINCQFPNMCTGILNSFLNQLLNIVI